jgi:two-component system response regulator VanR
VTPAAPQQGTSPRVLVVDDDRAVRESLRRSLEFNGYDVALASDGAEALATIAGVSPDALVIDVMMPRLDGIETTRALRTAGNDLPILVLTARDSVGDRVDGLDAGADDYLTKPFALQELVLRLRALDRRRAHHRPPVREIAGLRVDPFRREVYRDGRYVALTRKQFAVLEVLVAAEGGVVSAEELLRRAWDENADPFTNAVRITVSALRKRLGEPWVIATVAGAGYRITGGDDG